MNAEVAHGDFDLRVAEQDLNGTQVASLLEFIAEPGAAEVALEKSED